MGSEDKTTATFECPLNDWATQHLYVARVKSLKCDLLLHLITAIVLFTDGERVDSAQEQEQIKQTVRDCTTKIPTPLFIFAIEGKYVLFCNSKPLQ